MLFATRLRRLAFGPLWRRTIAGLMLLMAAGLPSRAQTMPPLKADRVLVVKSERVLQLIVEDQVLKTYPVALGRHPDGAKYRRGDERTPEGTYVIDGRSTRTPFRRKLHISYPNDHDRVRAQQAHVQPGGGIYIHGMPARFGRTDPVRFLRDWTNGCIAVGNKAIEEIWDAVPDGTPIEIRP